MQSETDPLIQKLGIVAIGRNEGARLVSCLESLKDVAGDHPVVYVDSGSTDGSVRAAKSLGATVVELDTSIGFTAARARNAGAQKLLELHPNVQAVQFLDGDCNLQAGWLDAACKTLASNRKFAVVCGRRRERNPDASLYNALIDIEWDTPVGEAKACGGDALYRWNAFQAVGGFDETIIAGEEPDLCYRLRQKGYVIQRIDSEMTLHDADLHCFQQWWKRAKRYGHAAFEGAWRHGLDDERYCVREVVGVFLWGALLPMICIVASALWLPQGLLLWLIYPLQVLRLTCRYTGDGRGFMFSLKRACLQVSCKFAELLGGLRFWVNRLSRRKSVLIEYKSAG